MKTLHFLPLFFITILFLGSAGPVRGFDHSNLDAVLKKYVDSKGMVDYAGLQKNRSELDSYLKSTAAVTEKEFKGWNENEQLAFLMNVYNAETLQLIIDHYPVKTIKKIGPLIGTPWDVKSVELFGDTTTLNKLEHGILREDYDEPRLHFAIVCAAMGCPPLRTEAFTAAKLDEQLDDQARVFLSQANKNRVEGDTLYLSPIFKWFDGDFEKGGKSVQDYVNPWFKADTSRLKVKYTDYDWDLNKQ
ncbi:MAG: DUF547 domain-containing protein [Verrucomicrobiales bacterium]|nr:DUF547 domain-containing protein [Verrucomicrobiales bacterium]